MSRPEVVVLVHGLWVHGLVMMWLEHRIESGGWRVENYSYPTVRLALAENAERLYQHCRTIEAPRLHLVGHSMGGVVVAKMLLGKPRLDIGRVVLVGTPFADSFSARRLAALPWGNAALGRTITEWLESDRAHDMGAYEIGVVAGSGGLGLGRIIAPDMPGENDGVVTVDETAVPGMRDRIVLSVSHSEMLVSTAVGNAICAFLRDGHFRNSGEA
jgi:hypothetical protein